MYSTSVAARPSAVGGVVAPTSLPLVWAPSLCQIPQHLLASPSGAERRASDSQQAPRLHTSSILMGMEGWCRVALCVRVHWGVCVYGGKPKSGLHEAECVCVCVWSLCGTGINSCRCSKWHDNQSPPHHHLPPLCQFVTAHPSVAMPSFNIEQEHDSRKNRRKTKRKEGEYKGTDKDCSPRGERWGRSTGVYQRAKTRHIHGGGILLTPLAQEQTTYLQHPGGLNLHQDFLSHVSSTCRNFSPAFYAQPEI